jgi:hypothetical protein
MEVSEPTEQNLLRLGRDWPTKHDDTTHLKRALRGYYRRDNGSLGKDADGVKLTESEDGYSSSHSAKRAKMGSCASESDPSDVGIPKVEATKDDKYDENTSEGDDEKDDETEKVVEEMSDNAEGDGGDAEEENEGDPEPFISMGVCRQTVGIDDDGNKEECGDETDGCSQLCPSCKQDMKRGLFAYGFMR